MNTVIFSDYDSSCRSNALLLRDDVDWGLINGHNGWWGISCADVDETRKFKEAYKQFVFDNAEDDDFLTVVDCHI